MRDFNMPPGVSARDIPGQDEAPDLVERLQAASPRTFWLENPDLLAEVAAEIIRLRDQVAAKQAQIDALMLEYCPIALQIAQVCSNHPDAPHGFDRTASHSLGRYVCECEGWEPPNATRKGEL